MKQAEKTAQMKIRVTSEVRGWLEDRARQNDRSMNAELNRILKAVQEQERQKAA